MLCVKFNTVVQLKSAFEIFKERTSSSTPLYTTSEYCRSLSLGGQPKERYSEEEKALLRDIAKIRGDLQRLNNYFGGRQYREVFEENRVIIEKLKKLLR